MKYNDLNISAHSSAKRLGRGIASGKGKTSGRGTKGQGARTGSQRRPGFEGGQNPMMQRLPKLPGFTKFRIKAENVFTDQLAQFAGKTVDSALLAEKGLVSNPFVFVKLLVGKAKLTQKVTVRLQAASANAISTIEAAGGTFEAVARAQRPKVTKPTKK